MSSAGLDIAPGLQLGGGATPALIAGPCVLENQGLALKIAEFCASVCCRLEIPYIFKASFDKANRSSVDSFRGPGLQSGLEMLAAVKAELGLPVLTDVHAVEQVEAAAQVVDILQIPAFLCRQTDLLLAAGASGRVVNLKKGQFMAPGDMATAVAKVRSTGNRKILLTERGTTFGYHNLVVDFRALPQMAATGCPVVFDATHSVQLPAAAGGVSGGERSMVPVLAAAAAAVGVDAFFFEVYPEPAKARCDGANSLALTDLEPLLRRLLAIHRAAGANG